MIHELKSYPSYRDSGVEWLGAVPEHWEVLPALAAYRPKQVRNTGMVETTVLSLSYGRIIVKPAEKLHGLVPESFETYQIVEPGNIIVRTTDLQNDQKSLRVGQSRHRGIITSAYMCLETTGRVSAEFGYQFLNAYDLLKIIYGFGSGLRQNLDFGHIKRMPVLVPTPDEQAAIVRFLDHADRRIRRYIRAKQKLIKLLEEQKQAIIHRAVTRGLNPDVRRKPSGVEWLGEVPEHWEVRKLRHCGSILGGMTPSMENRGYWGGDIPWVTPKDMKQFSIGDSKMRVTDEALRNTALREIPPNSVLLVVRGMILARRVPIAWATAPVTINQDMKALKVASGVDAEFLALSMDSAQDALAHLIDEAGHGTKRLPTERWSNMMIACPPPCEQRLITRHVVRVAGDLDRASASALREIALLREYRTRLIADVVTGKLDVRAAAANLSDAVTPIDGVSRKHLRANIHFRRSVLAAEIVERYHRQQRFGRVKLQKVIILAERHLRLEEVESAPIRAAAGPFDNQMMRSIHAQLERQKWFRPVRREGSGYKYVPLSKRGEHRKYFERYWGDRRGDFDALLALLEPLDTERAEIVATLYMAWNDFVIRGQAVSDGELVDEVLHHWDEAKQRIPAERWQKAIGWMRENKLVPSGFGSMTR